MRKITILFLVLISSYSYSQTWSSGVITFNGSYNAEVDVTASTVTLTLNGPDDRWFGMGFGVTCMTNNNDDVVIFDGTNLTDRNYIGVGVQPAVDATQNWSITSNTTSGGTRTLIATRARDTGDANDFVFPTSTGSINFVWAYRSSAGFSITSHGGNRGSTAASFTLGVEEFDINTKFAISPNPASTEFKVQLPSSIENASVNVYDVLGKQVFATQISEFDATVNVSDWNSGIYLVRVTSGDISQTKRFIKQ